MFTHLHVHTEYSLLDGMSRIPHLVSRAKEMGMDSLAITDHGTMYGVIQFYLAAKEAGIKPIIGCEVYVAQNSRFDHGTVDRDSYHLVLLAKNQTGYQNLIQLTTKAHLEGFYYKPRVDKALLEEYHEGLVALSACASGEIPRLIADGRQDEAKQVALWYKKTFGDFYLEVQRHPIPEIEQINQVLIPMSSELDIPLVATNDVHYVNQEDASAHDLLLCIQTNSSVYDDKRMKMAGDFFYLRPPQEMARLFEDIPEALTNTERIADLCQLELEFGRLHLPEIDLPAGKTPDEYLTDLCNQGLQQQYPEPSDEVIARLEYELDVIRKTEFANYFLVVWDIISFVRKNNIRFGVRGSAAASIALHCLGITEIDPIEHKLVFERFLNLERREMPDIDMDFEDERRDEVIYYVSQKYGEDHVAQIITFGTLGARAALRDVGRALGMAYSDVDRVARLIPFGPGMTLAKALSENSELNQLYINDAIVRNLIDSAKRIEGIARHASTHAAGVVISKDPLTQYVPLQRVNRADAQDWAMAQFSMEDVARIGLLKMDFLGLINLSVLGKATEIIKQNKNIDIDLYHLPMDDEKTFKLLSSGETMGVFQLEGTGMRRYIKELKPTVFSDIAAMVALYRPGPMEHIPSFIKSKQGIEPIRYPDPSLASILEETYGVIVYQEQVLFIVRTLARYSLGQADIFRKAMGKKITAVMKKERINFTEGAKKNGFSAELAEQVFDLIEPFSGYAFNKAHAVSYALIAYQTAYLKANFPAEYVTAFLIANSGQAEKVANAVAECRRLGITILRPDINHSQSNFTIEKDNDGKEAIRFGLNAIKNVGTGAVEPIIEERDKNGSFKSIEDLCHRADLNGVNRRVMESLIKAGAMDSLGDRGTLLQNVNLILSLAQREQHLRDTGQSTMFDLWGETVPTPTSSLEMTAAEVPTKDKLAWEKELTGVYLSEHPFSAFANSSMPDNATLCGQIDADMKGQNVVVAGMVTSIRNLLTKERQPFITATLEDLDGSLEVTVWPKVYANTRDLWEEGAMLLVEGKVKIRDSQVQIVCDHVDQYSPENIPVKEDKEEEISLLETTESLPQNHRLIISISQTDDEESDLICLNKIISTFNNYPGDDEVRLRVTNGEKIYNLKFSHLRTKYCPELREALVGLVGEKGIKVD